MSEEPLAWKRQFCKGQQKEQGGDEGREYYIYPEQLYSKESFKGIFISLCHTICDQKRHRFETCSEWNNFMNF